MLGGAGEKVQPAASVPQRRGTAPMSPSTSNEARTAAVAHAVLAPDEAPSITLLATGSARLEGQTFHALADEISYDESKGLYMLKSFGDRESMLWREAQPGGERTAVVTRTTSRRRF